MLAVIQARFSSTRLPGKVLRPLVGRPMLVHLFHRLRMAKRVDEIVVATSTENDDDAIVRLCGEIGVRHFRGPLDDVAERLAQAAEEASAAAFVRISGDSPLICPNIVDAVIALYEMEDVDLATNVQARTFPKGLSVEAIRIDALRRAQKLMRLGDAEHVTPPFYRHASQFRIVNLASGHDWGAVQMSVDTPEDFALTERMLQEMGTSTAVLEVDDLIALRERCLGEESV
ncbi:MAG TPA: NTP transferase domain-containing protein [Candidatus Acidoferrales bacterium]|nr:NTP transferase domain-containing protein [Candidatus Acidoferrales bacterium]